MKTRIGAILLLAAGLAIALPTPALLGPPQYVAGGTAVVKESGQQAALDQGGVVCELATGNGAGGACVGFGPFDSILVTDAAFGGQVAFQVCIDNDGDGVCTPGNASAPGGSGPCDDELFFSHNDKGTFFNPLGPLPKGFAPGCPGGLFPGYVVFICDGVHIEGGPGSGAAGHAHPATSGTAQGAIGGTGFGDFCLPAPSAPPKPYVVV